MISKMWKAIILWCCNTVFVGTHFFKVKRILLNTCKGVKVGYGTCIVTPIRIPVVSTLSIGDHCWINRDFTLEGNGKVIIGNKCDLAPTVTMTTGSHQIGDANRRAGQGFSGEIIVGDGCWLGNRSLILPNVHVGKGVIVAAGAVVTKNISDNILVGGVPAKYLHDL